MSPCLPLVARRLLPAGVLVLLCSATLARQAPSDPVPSFTKTDASGKTTVDAPIKRGVARVEMAVSGPARVSVASGVVNGNELSLAGAR